MARRVSGPTGGAIWLLAALQAVVVLAAVLAPRARRLLEPAAVAGPGAPAERWTEVALWDEARLGPPLAAHAAFADQAALGDRHPLPRAALELSGQGAAAAGGGEPGATLSFTGRRDRGTLAHEIWNDPERYQLFRRRTADQRASPEALIRQPTRGFDERDPQGAARAGTVGHPGLAAGEDGASGTEVATAEASFRERDPYFDRQAPARETERRDGDARASDLHVLAETGRPATEASRRGAARDALSTVAESNQTEVHVLELSRPASGGTRTGVAGRAGRGLLADGAGRGSAATRANVPRGDGTIALFAQREDPYFRHMFERVDRLVEYPRDLALALEQGEVTVAFTLSPAGDLADLAVAVPSGFGELDDEVARAFRAAAPFGPVPGKLLGRARAIRVKAPYTFNNPLIR